MDGKISWVCDLVPVFSPNDISGLRSPKNVKLGTKMVSSMRMIRALRFLEKVLIAAIFAKNAKNSRLIRLISF